jgi:hypothetical protein
MTLPTLASLRFSLDNGCHGTKGFGEGTQDHIPQPSQQEGSTIDNIFRQYNNFNMESYASPNRPMAAFDRKLSDRGMRSGIKRSLLISRIEKVACFNQKIEIMKHL